MQMKIQPIDDRLTIKNDQLKPAAAKSRLKRLFERQFTKLAFADGKEKDKDDVDGGGELESSSVCLDKLVISFMEDSNDKPAKCSRSRCNCFHGNCDDDSSGDEFAGDELPITAAGSGDALEMLKCLVTCESREGRNLLADASMIVEANKSKIGKGKDSCIKIVTENLESLGYVASICKSKWEKTLSIPAGEYEYINVMINSDRFIVDIDFRSEFEIARSTKSYRTLLQSLPLVFVGKSDRVQQIVTLVCEAARQSLKKKGLHFPPWRKLEYMKAKWLSRTAADSKSDGIVDVDMSSAPNTISTVNFNGEFKMRGVVAESEKITVLVSQWTPPAVRPKSVTAGANTVTGLSSVLKDKLPSPAEF